MDEVVVTKICTKCGEEKCLNEFYADKQAKDGYRNNCKECHKGKSTEWRRNNPDKRKLQFKEWYGKNADKAKEYQKNYRAENDSLVKQQRRNWYIKNKEKAKKASQQWRENNRDKHIESVKQWRINNPEKAREYDHKSSKKRRSTPQGKLNANICRYISYSLHGEKDYKHWEDLVGYTLSDLKKHLEKQFKNGMTWENYGSYWHTDHKIPKSAFNFKTPNDIDFHRCWSLNNLQPLESRKNILKGAKLDRPFQPSFAIAI